MTDRLRFAPPFRCGSFLGFFLCIRILPLKAGRRRVSLASIVAKLTFPETHSLERCGLSDTISLGRCSVLLRGLTISAVIFFQPSDTLDILPSIFILLV